MNPRLAIGSLLLIALQLSGCQPSSHPALGSTPSRPALSSPTVPESTLTLIPEPSITAPATRAVPPTPTLPPQPEEYRDCAKTPGIPGCDPSAPSIEGKFAFYDRSNGLVMIDLASGLGWQLPTYKPVWVEWSPNGDRLLLRQELQDEYSLPINFTYSVLDTRGNVLNSYFMDRVRWNADNTLQIGQQSAPDTISSVDGANAWLERPYAIDKLKIHIQDTPSSPVRLLSLDTDHRDSNYFLKELLPGSHHIIAYSLPQSQSASMLMGGRIEIIDTREKIVNATKLWGFLDDPYSSSMKENTLAVIDFAHFGQYSGQLALLDGTTGQVQYPLGDFHLLQELAWQPGSSDWLALVRSPNLDIDPRLELDQIKGTSLYTAGIYLFNPYTGETQQLVETEPGWRVGKLHWSKDGQYLLYTHFEFAKNQPTASLMAYRMSDGKNWSLVTNLASPQYSGPMLEWDLNEAVIPAN